MSHPRGTPDPGDPTVAGLTPEQVLESVTDPVLAVDRGWRITYLNAAAERAYGRRREACLGRDFWGAFPGLGEGALGAGPRRVMRDRAPARFEAYHEPLGRWFEVDAYPAGDGGVVFTFRDVTERRRATARLQASEERYRALFESTDEGFCILQVIFDENGRPVDYRFVEVNPAFEQQTGLRDALGKTVRELVPGIEPVWFEVYGQVALTGAPCRFVDHARALGRWFDVSAFRVGDPADRHVAVLFSDITQRKLADDQFRAIVNQATVGVAQTDLSGRFILVNPRYCEIVGYPAAELAEMRMQDLTHPDDLARNLEPFQALAAGGPDFVIEKRYVRKDGSPVWVSNSVTAVRDAEGRPESVLAVALDVTDRKRAEARQRFLSDLAAATQPLADPDEVTAVTARLLAEYLGADRCAYAAMEGGSVLVSGDHPRGGPGLAGLWPASTFGAGCARAMVANEPFVVEDADADPRLADADRPAYRAAAARAVICVPLHKGGQFTAALAVHQAAPRRWAPDEVELVQAVAGRCWEALERARAARRLREGEEQLRLITDSVPALIAYVDAGQRYRIVNRQYEEWFGRPRADIEGRHLREVVGEAAYERLRPHVERGLAGERFEFEAFAPYPTGGRHIHAAFVPRFEQGRPSGYLSLITDVTERVRAEEALRDADRRKDEFLALLAHELRNPLAPLRNGLQVTRLSDDPEVRRGAQEMMERQLAHMVRLIDDLLDVSRISRGKLTLRRQRTPLSDVISSAVETARPLIEAAGHELTLLLPSDPVDVDADLTRLAQVFSNLLTNAAKYTEPGGRIRLVAERRDGGVAVRVSDNGIGIPAESLPTIFDMFSQVDRSLERSTGGLGIGLALVKGLVEMHGGAVAAESPGVGLGSTFTVTLPEASRAPAAPAPPRRDAGAAGAGRRVLVVDDNHDSAESMALMLRLLGSDARTAHDGLQAVEAAERFRPELILMDVGMPRLNGYEATRRIRERPWGRDVKVVALTGWGQDGDRARSREAGCDAHLVKPVDFAELQRLLARFWGAPGAAP